ncbi:MAG: hypothetical protein R3B70_39785 [Polyangiaceae bacterium]
MTLVAEALEPFKLKPLGDTTTHAATPGPGRSAASGGREASQVGPSPVGRRPVTRTAVLEMDQAGKPRQPAPSARRRLAARFGASPAVPPAPAAHRPPPWCLGRRARRPRHRKVGSAPRR